jgi:uncharacterized protein involved in type VI secretion and phage assembly
VSTPALPGVVIGVVTSNADPGSSGRVQVRFWTPAGSAESTWAPVMRPAGRPDGGPSMLPEAGDTVVLGFEHGDVHRPIVLGGLASAAE